MSDWLKGYIRNYIIKDCEIYIDLTLYVFFLNVHCAAMSNWSKKDDFLTSENVEHLVSLISESNIYQNGFQNWCISNKKV